MGFRFFVREKAASCGIIGWVRNLHDGTVEIHAEGDKINLDDFLKEVKKGPFFGYVNELDIDWTAPEDKYTGFNITY